MKKQFLHVLIFIGFVAFSYPQSVNAQGAGTPDPTFNGDGKYIFDFGFQDNLNDVTLQNDQKLICTGVALTPAFTGVLKVVRLNTDGTPDNTFGTNGVFSFSLFNETYGYESFVRNDGKIVVVGVVYVEDYTADMLIVRINADGTLDTSFGTDGYTLYDFHNRDDFAQAVAQQPDGKIVVSGTVTDTTTYYNTPCVVRFTENGALDTTFGTNGITKIDALSIDNELTSVAIQPDGKIVASGHFENEFTGSADFDILTIRLDADGMPDAGFGINGVVKTSINGGIDDSFGMEIDNNGNIIVAGFTTLPFTLSLDMVLLKYDNTGTLDPGFGTAGIVTFNNADLDDVATDLKIQSDGKILVGGSSGLSFLGPRDLALWRYLPNGTADNTFGTNGFVTTTVLPYFQDCNSLVLQNDGKIVAAGRANNGNNNDIAVLRYRNDVASAIDAVDLSDKLSVYPNPLSAGQTLQVNLSETNLGNNTLELVDIAGKIVLSETVSLHTQQSNVLQFQIPANLVPGVYCFRINNGQEQCIKKVIVK